jgi:hypothetical protein
MNDEASPSQGPRITWVEILAGAIALLLLLTLVWLCLPAISHSASRGNITKGISNCRQILLALKLYASDHDGKYPVAALAAPKSANEVFRILFKEETLDSEAIFGCPISSFNPDGNIGNDEDRSQALEAGENHWAMTRGLKDNSPENIPLVFENPVSATWPPKWNPDAKGTPVRGRAWSTGIIIGLNDGSAQIVPLASKRGAAVGLKPTTGSLDLFDAAIDPVLFPKGEVLDVE